MKLHIRLKCSPYPQLVLQMDTQNDDVQLQMDTAASNVSLQPTNTSKLQVEDVVELEIMMRPA